MYNSYRDENIARRTQAQLLCWVAFCKNRTLNLQSSVPRLTFEHVVSPHDDYVIIPTNNDGFLLNYRSKAIHLFGGLFLLSDNYLSVQHEI